MANLVQRQIVDKNGNLTTRWIRASDWDTSTRNIPAPKQAIFTTESKLPRGAVKEMKEIKSRLTEKLKQEHEASNPLGYGYPYDRYMSSLKAVNEAVDNREYDKLRIYDEHMTVTQHPEHLSAFIDHLQAQGHESIPERFTPELMEEFTKLSRKVRTVTLGGFPDALKDLDNDERDAISNRAGELMFLHPGSGEKIYSLIVDHGVTNPDNLTATLEESERINTPFIGGIL
jgi:hypothetical protein